MSAATLAERLAARIAARGPIPVADYVEAALYDETDGFYATEGRAGRDGDFLTAPEVGPLFGAVLAGAVDRWWADAGRPDRWLVIEHGAGPGTLARSILAAEPECLVTGALEWVAVDRAPAQRAGHPVHPAVRSVGPGDAPGSGAHIVIANELLDNLPFDIVERTGDGWVARLVDHDHGDRFRTVTGPPVAEPPAVDAPPGARLPVQAEARGWVTGVRAAHPDARIVVFDYGASTAELLARAGGWLRTFRGHGEPSDWLTAPGTCDITVDVDLDQLQADAPATRVESQADFLRHHGIDALVEEGRRAWEAGAAIGDLAALRARSRIREAEALIDPTGMGGFTVLEWAD